MAMSLMYLCRCGKRYLLYIPKLRLMRQMSDHVLTDKEIEDLKNDDREERENGEIEHVKWIAKPAQATFIDGSIRDAFQCECGNVIDIDAFISKQNEKEKIKGKTQIFYCSTIKGVEDVFTNGVEDVFTNGVEDVFTNNDKAKVVYYGCSYRVNYDKYPKGIDFEQDRKILDDLQKPIEDCIPQPMGLIERYEVYDKDTDDVIVMYRAPYIPKEDTKI